MHNLKLEIQYEGTRYNGWQRQGNTENTIQGKVEQVLGRMAGHAIEIHAAGRTDAGAHARAQIAHTKLKTDKTPDEIRAFLNTYLPGDIAVTACTFMDERFHARLTATGKRYLYRIHNSAVPNVFLRRYSAAVSEPLDMGRMLEAAALLRGTHDFRAFCSLKRFRKSTVRTLYAIDITQEGDDICIAYLGSGFLYHMVRILTGTLVEIAAGEREPCEIAKMLETGDRALAGKTMPPEGLMLDEVFYQPMEEVCKGALV